MKVRTILVVEDSAMTMELVADLLEAVGIRILKAETAEQGISSAIDHQPDLILMDMALPGLDGMRATRRLKQDPRTARIPVVALTAQVMKGDEERARDAGCCGFITKPIDTRTFSRSVAEFMSGAGGPATGPPAEDPPPGVEE